MEIQADQLLNILKWVGIAFAAGFVGYFGRYFSKAIIARLSRRKEELHPEKVSTTKTAEQQAATLEKARLKLEKKRLTLEHKRQKKGS